MTNRGLLLVAQTLWWVEVSSTELGACKRADGATGEMVGVRAWLRTNAIEQRRFNAHVGLLDRLNEFEVPDNLDDKESH